MTTDALKAPAGDDSGAAVWSGLGTSYVNCLNAWAPVTTSRQKQKALWTKTGGLVSLLHTPEEYIDELKDIIQR